MIRPRAAPCPPRRHHRRSVTLAFAARRVTLPPQHPAPGTGPPSHEDQPQPTSALTTVAVRMNAASPAAKGNWATMNHQGTLIAASTDRSAVNSLGSTAAPAPNTPANIPPAMVEKAVTRHATNLACAASPAPSAAPRSAERSAQRRHSVIDRAGGRIAGGQPVATTTEQGRDGRQIHV